MVASQFLSAHDPHDPFINVALSPNFAQDQTIFAATSALTIKMGVNALLKSTDGGVTWNFVQGLPSNSINTVIAFSPAYSVDQTVFTAGGGGLFQTTNQGTSWTALTTQSLASVALSPNFATDNTLFVVTNQKTILKSTNRGQTLTAVATPPGLTAGLTVIAISPNCAIDNTLLLGTIANGIFESTNNGNSWIQVTPGLTLPKVTALTFSPAFSSDQTAFAGTAGSGVLVSTNAGILWKASNSGIADLNVTAIALSPGYSSNSTLWVATAGGGVLQSTNLGASWGSCTTVARTLSNLTKIHYQTLAAGSNGSGSVLYLGMYEGLWTMSAGATSWQYLDTMPTRLIRYINLSPNYANDQTIFANTYGGGNLWSSNGGVSWASQNTGMQFSYTDASGISPNYAVDQTAFCGNFDGLQKSTNGGAIWTLTKLAKGSYPRALAVSPNYAQDTTLMVGSTTAGQAGVYVSNDGGNTWSPSRLGTGVVSIAISPTFASDQTAFAAGNTAGLYKTTDGGATWTLLTMTGIPGGLAKVVLSPSFATDGTAFAAVVAGGIYKSTDGGSTWTVVPGAASMRALDLEVSPNYANDQTFFAGTIGQGLLEFTSGGATMTPVASFPDTFVLAVGISPNFVNDNTLFAAAYHGLYESTDGGISWTYMAVYGRIEESRTTNGNPPQPPTIVYQGPWSSVIATPSASTNTFMITRQSGSVAVLNFVGSGVRWVSVSGPQQGSASIQLDGVSQGTVSLTAPTNQLQQSAWELHGLACGPHILTLTASLPKGKGQEIVIDAFDVWVDTCPFISASPKRPAAPVSASKH